MASSTIVQFDSEDYYLEVVDLILYSTGIQVAESAIGRKQAVSLLEKIQAGELKPDIAIIDTMLQAKHTEGKTVAEQLRKLSPNTKIIAYTILPDEADWADDVAIKSLKDSNRTIKKALEQQLGITISDSNVIEET